MPEDESDLAFFLAQLPARDAGHGDRARLQSDRARRRRAGRGDPARPRLQRRDGRARARVRAGAAVPDVKVARAAQEAGNRRARLPARHPGRDRRRAADERRRLRPRDQGRADRGARRRPAGTRARLHQRRHALQLSSLRRARGRHLHAGAVPGRAGRSGRHCRGDGQDHRGARGDAADQEPHRRLDLQESAGPQGLAAHRRRRLPRPSRSATRRCRSCTAIS